MLSSIRRGPKRNEIIAIDLGSRVTKAVHLCVRGTEIYLLNYVSVELGEPERAGSREVLAEHLRKVVRSLGATTRRVVLSLGASKSLLTHLDLPGASPSDLRRMIRLSPRNYLQREVNDHVFDCHVGDTRGQPGTDHVPRARRKAKVLVGGAREADVELVSGAARDAGLVVDRVTLSQVAIANAFQARPEERGEVVALLDLGFAATSINIMMAGELVFTRVINFGAEKFSDVVAQSARLRPVEAAEGEAPVADEMQARLQRAVLLLAREVDASIGFFVSQHEATVGRILVSGGSARSQFILQTLEAELGLPCESWSPAGSLRLELPEVRLQELEYEAPQFLVAAGAGLAVLRPGLILINLLAEEQETSEWRRRDPVRRAFWAGGVAVVLMLLWGGLLGYRLWRANGQLAALQAQYRTLQDTPGESINNANRIQEMEKRLLALYRQGQDRLLWAPMLSALQFTTVEGIEFHKLSISQTLTKLPAQAPATAARGSGAGAAAGGPAAAKAKTPPVTEKVVLSIQGTNYGAETNVFQLIGEIMRQPYFKEHLRTNGPVRMVGAGDGIQVDPSNPNRTFRLFTIECACKERVLSNE